MKISKLVISLFLVLFAGCFDPMRDSAIEDEVSKLLKTNEAIADEVIAMSKFGQVVVNVSSQKPFDMEQQARQELSEKIAQAAIKIHPDTSGILISFVRVKPEMQQIAYSWKSENGKLLPIAK
jgi:S-adenosylmethionine hydrolase